MSALIKTGYIMYYWSVEISHSPSSMQYYVEMMGIDSSKLIIWWTYEWRIIQIANSRQTELRDNPRNVDSKLSIVSGNLTNHIERDNFNFVLKYKNLLWLFWSRKKWLFTIPYWIIWQYCLLVQILINLNQICVKCNNLHASCFDRKRKIRR